MMSRTAFVILCFLALALPASAGKKKKKKKSKKKAPSKSCLVCRAVMYEVELNVSSQASYKTIELGRGAWLGDGKAISFATSETHLNEVVEDLCEMVFTEYHPVENNSFKIEHTPGSSKKLQNNNALKVKMGLAPTSQGIEKPGMGTTCSTVVEGNEEAIVGHFHDGGTRESAVDELCHGHCVKDGSPPPPRAKRFYEMNDEEKAALQEKRAKYAVIKAARDKREREVFFEKTYAQPTDKDRDEYYLGAFGKICQAVEEISTEEGCHHAAERLDLCHQDAWTGAVGHVPRYCSIRVASCGTSDLHFNEAHVGQGREDLQPICRNPNHGKRLHKKKKARGKKKRKAELPGEEGRKIVPKDEL